MLNVQICGMTISLFGLLCCCHTVYYVSLLGRHSYFIIIIVYTDVVWPYCSFWSSVQLPHCFGLLCCLTNCTICIERLWTAPEKFQAPSPPTRVPLYKRHWRGDPFLPCTVSVDTMAVHQETDLSPGPARIGVVGNLTHYGCYGVASIMRP
jgi:hypothetical protein